MGRPSKYLNDTERKKARLASKKKYYKKNRLREQRLALKRYYKAKKTAASPHVNTRNLQTVTKSDENCASMGVAADAAIDEHTDVPEMLEALWGLLKFTPDTEEKTFQGGRAREVLDAVDSIGWIAYRPLWEARYSEASDILARAEELSREANRRGIEFHAACQQLWRAANRALCCEEEMGLLMDLSIEEYKQALAEKQLLWHAS